MKKGDNVLIHAGGSGIGTTATQLTVLAGAKPIVTAGSKEKIEKAISLGAVTGFNYKEGDFTQKVLDATNGKELLYIFTFTHIKVHVLCQKMILLCTFNHLRS